MSRIKRFKIPHAKLIPYIKNDLVQLVQIKEFWYAIQIQFEE